MKGLLGLASCTHGVCQMEMDEQYALAPCIETVRLLHGPYCWHESTAVTAWHVE
jgi:hypothetical protein